MCISICVLVCCSTYTQKYTLRKYRKYRKFTETTENTENLQKILKTALSLHLTLFIQKYSSPSLSFGAVVELDGSERTKATTARRCSCPCVCVRLCVCVRVCVRSFVCSSVSLAVVFCSTIK